MTTTLSHTPTAEQQSALDLFATGRSFAIEAGAGTGKTSTLVMLAESTGRTGRYIAFNKAIVTDASEKMPETVGCSTAHSLAFRAVGKKFQRRLNAPRVTGEVIARQLGITAIEVNVGGVEKRRLAPGFLAGHVMRALGRFCQTADAEPTARHFEYLDGIDMPDAEGRRTYENNRTVADALLRFLIRAWTDVSDPQGQLPYKHDHYLKLWQLSAPVIEADFILFDEVQDADPVMADIVMQQHARGTQVVLVGDSQQAIYEWRGAVNAFQLFALPETTFLTQSWRFGDAIAEQANRVLARIPDAVLRLIGTPAAESSVAAVSAPKAILTRTNATAVREVLAYIDRGQHPHLVGGGKDVVAFAKGAAALQAGRRTEHPDLACFPTWTDVLDYVSNDPQGSDLRLLVKLVDEFTAERIIETLGERMPSEAQADVVVSTAHKAKGREWDTVRLAADFAAAKEGTEPSPAELRLLYVAVTRARVLLDITLVPTLADEEDGEVVAEVEAPADDPTLVVGDALLDGTIQSAAASAPQRPAGCPSCGRTDVVRSTGMIGAHRCTAISG